MSLCALLLKEVGGGGSVGPVVELPLQRCCVGRRRFVGAGGRLFGLCCDCGNAAAAGRRSAAADDAFAAIVVVEVEVAARLVVRRRMGMRARGALGLRLLIGNGHASEFRGKVRGVCLRGEGDLERRSHTLDRKVGPVSLLEERMAFYLARTCHSTTESRPWVSI